MLTKSEDLKYQLESLASYEPSDIDNPEFEVGYEDNNGNEGFATVCCVDVAKRALERIKELEALSAWVSVKDDMPEATEDKNVLGHNGNYAFECNFDDGYWCNIGGEDITHWMPLPKAPSK